jgi:hypothetical protein
MDVAALITWLLTALGGFVMLGIWLRHGGVRAAQTGSSAFPAGVVFGHFLLAAAGLVVWIIFVLSDDGAGLAWTAFVILLPVAVLGFAMLIRWLAGRRTAVAAAAADVPEQRFPVPVVVVHGLLAVTTVVLVFIAALSVD